MNRSTRALSAALFVAGALGTPAARASELGADGYVHFATSAHATYGFESAGQTLSAGARVLAWAADGASFAAAPPTAEALGGLLVDSPVALEGTSSLRVRVQDGVGLALFDTTALADVASSRWVVSMWGRAVGAEPSLEVVYVHPNASAGPWNFAHVNALRTGRETSDGWAEYSTGPIDGAVFGVPISGIYLTARYDTSFGPLLMTDVDWPSFAQTADDSQYALIDAVEMTQVDGTPQTAACTADTATAACGAGGECFFGHCVDAALVWGATPPASHLNDLGARLNFEMAHLAGGRDAIQRAASPFAGAVASITSGSDPNVFGALSEQVWELRNGHTWLGEPTTYRTWFYPRPYDSSGAIDACFGVARNDIAGDAALHYVVFAAGGASSLGEKLAPGDILTSIDGQSPDAWLGAHARRYLLQTTDDDAALPAIYASVLPGLLSRHATTIAFARCTTGGACDQTIEVPLADELYAGITKHDSLTGSTYLSCSQRFRPAVAGATQTYSNGGDVVASARDGGVTSVQFDGFDPLDKKTWADQMNAALDLGGPYVFDARMGHGGYFSLGQWFVQLMRPSTDPAGDFVMPRGTIEDPDPAWLFDASWDACRDEQADPSSPTSCSWSASDSTSTTESNAVLSTARVAWIDTLDVSMNDFTPRLLKGAKNVRIFAPFATSGSYGQVVSLPPVAGAWTSASFQGSDGRFGASIDDARKAGWESGHGVVPDEVVVQKVSDILQGRDTLLEAARGWVTQ